MSSIWFKLVGMAVMFVHSLPFPFYAGQKRLLIEDFKMSEDTLPRTPPREFCEKFTVNMPIGANVRKDCVITNIFPNSGLNGKASVGDKVVSIDDKKVTKLDELTKAVKEVKEKKVTVAVRHSTWSWSVHKSTTLDRVIVEKDIEKTTGKAIDVYYVMIRVPRDTDVPTLPLGVHVRYDARERLTVVAVDPKSLAAVHLKPGDVIKEVNEKPVASKTMLRYYMMESLQKTGTVGLLVETPAFSDAVRDTAVEMATDVVEIGTKQIERIKQNKMPVNLKDCLTKNPNKKKKIEIAKNERSEYFLYFYYILRKQSKWSPARQKALRLFFNSGLDQTLRRVPLEDPRTNEIDAFDVLAMKSALMFMSQDFPDFAETVLYSPLMELLDETIASWPENDPPFSTVREIVNAREQWKILSVNNASHVWWKGFEKISTWRGQSIKLVLKRHAEEILELIRYRVVDLQNEENAATAALAKAEEELRKAEEAAKMVDWRNFKSKEERELYHKKGSAAIAVVEARTALKRAEYGVRNVQSAVKKHEKTVSDIMALDDGGNKIEEPEECRSQGNEDN